MTAYYNEFDPFAAAWLRNLIDLGAIAPGIVDERSIEDVTPNDLRGFTQVHLFAGIGVWSHALRSAGWADDRPVWTGSCPCQPFSSAGKAGGFDDERHLWPAFYRLVTACRPAVVFGEQVASALAIGGSALQRVSADEKTRRLSDPQSWRLSEDVQKLRERVGADDQALVHELQARLSAETTARKTRVLTDPRREEPSQIQTVAILPKLAGSAGDNRQGRVRSDRSSIRSECPGESMERPVDRPGSAGSGLYPAEYARGPLRPKYDGGDVGHDDRHVDCGFDARKSLNDRVIGETCGNNDAENGPAWLDAVFADLETARYSCGALVFPACGIGAPHIRQRLFWVAVGQPDGNRDGFAPGREIRPVRAEHDHEHGDSSSRMADADDPRLEGRREPGRERADQRSAGSDGVAVGVADATDGGVGQRNEQRSGEQRLQPQDGSHGGPIDPGARTGIAERMERPGPTNGLWRDADWLFCRDGKWRPVEPKSFPLVTGATNRVGRLRGYGNAIVAAVAQGFIESVMEVLDQ